MRDHFFLLWCLRSAYYRQEHAAPTCVAAIAFGVSIIFLSPVFPSFLVFIAQAVGDSATMRLANRFQSRVEHHSSYQRIPFYAIKLLQLVSCVVDFAIMSYFISNLRGSYVPVPWTFIIVRSIPDLLNFTSQ
jgi:hypothetical protein